jgi:TolB protein
MARPAALPLLLVTAALGCGGPGPDSPCAQGAPGAPWLTFATARAGSYDIAIVRADGSCGRTLTHDPAQDLFPTWGPAGRIVFASDRGGGLGLWVHDLATGREVPLDVGPLRATGPAFSPDGTRLAFEGSASGSTSSAIYLVPAAGGVPIQLAAHDGANGGPAWSPDGATVYFVSDRAGPHEVFSVPAAGGEALQLTTGSRILGRPAASADGADLAWTRAAGTGSEVVRRAVAGGPVVVVTSSGDSEPAHQPGTGRLAVRSYRYGPPELVLLDPVGGAPPARITADAAPCGGPAFAPAP